MKETNTIFICDSCEKRSGPSEDFPYKKEWVYLYAFDFKKEKEKNLGVKDKHFCSQLCLEVFLKKIIEGKK